MNKYAQKHYDKLVADLKIGAYKPKTIEIYSWLVRMFIEHHGGRTPTRLGADEIREFLVFLIDEKKVSREYIRQTRAALKFFYKTTLRRAIEVDWVPVPRKQKRIPLVLSGTEVNDLIKATDQIKYQSVFAVMYSGGLRIKEACCLKVADIDSKRMVIRVRGKGGRERITILSCRLLDQLRQYYRETRPQKEWLFPGKKTNSHVPDSTVRQVFHEAVKAGKISKKVTPHNLRHSFATHLIETGCDVTVVQALLGHKSLLTTQIYTHVSVEQIARTKSPWDLIGTSDGSILG